MSDHPTEDTGPSAAASSSYSAWFKPGAGELPQKPTSHPAAIRNWSKPRSKRSKPGRISGSGGGLPWEQASPPSVSDCSSDSRAIRNPIGLIRSKRRKVARRIVRLLVPPPVHLILVGLIRALLIGLMMSVVMGLLVGLALPLSGSLLVISGQLLLSTAMLLGVVWLLPYFRRRR